MRAPHPVATMIRVRELHAAGWTTAYIHRILQREQIDAPAYNTIKRWVDEGYAERQRQGVRDRAARRRARESNYRWPAIRGSVWRLGRMCALREAGLSHADIAKVMTFDFPDTPLTRHEVERAITEDRLPRRMRKAAA